MSERVKTTNIMITKIIRPTPAQGTQAGIGSLL